MYRKSIIMLEPNTSVECPWDGEIISCCLNIPHLQPYFWVQMVLFLWAWSDSAKLVEQELEARQKQ